MAHWAGHFRSTHTYEHMEAPQPWRSIFPGSPQVPVRASPTVGLTPSAVPRVPVQFGSQAWGSPAETIRWRPWRSEWKVASGWPPAQPTSHLSRGKPSSLLCAPPCPLLAPFRLPYLSPLFLEYRAGSFSLFRAQTPCGLLQAPTQEQRPRPLPSDTL